eukprot:TRINITY_DN48762_c0_g1_i1.p1 TRINITY_DN48762_c0_g1~~TRINITY_DN48762_c0_g1_i1.p1  ORF type:complete len:594 (-),score=90.37 TRINITY_DN48762_c0_g1_i1:186-1850(-)
MATSPAAPCHWEKRIFADGPPGPASHGDSMSDDVVQKIADFASTMLLDILALAVVSRQYGTATRRAASRLLSCNRTDAQWLLTERMAAYFLQWSHLKVCGFAGTVSTAAIEIPEDDTLVYHCCRCRSPILRFSDIFSNNYHGAWGPAFLVNRLCNAEVERLAYATAFVTGGYTVSDVTCSVCKLMLGKKYIEARDPVNRFKVGKYLLEQTMVFVPGCCSGTRTTCRQAKLGGSVGVCVRCSVHLQSRIIQATLLMTDNLSPGASRRLRTILSEECALMEPGSSIGSSKQRLSQRSASGGDEVVASTEGAQAIEQGGMNGLISRRLALLCGAIPDGVEAKFFASFVHVVASSMVAAAVPEPHLDDSPSQRGDARASEGNQHHRNQRNLQRHSNHHRRPSGNRHDYSMSAAELGSFRSRSFGSSPTGNAEPAAAISAAISDVARNSAIATASTTASSDPGKTDHITAAARIIRWDVAAQAAASVSRDFQIARGLVVGLKAWWTPSWPAEKAGAERLVDVLVDKLSLDKEDRDLLLQELGLKKPPTFCSWFPCRHGW